jgi:glutamyl-tRNA synthetase
VRNESIRVRFAPSPTGYLHVGGARTALFDWLFARKQNGVFVLRIEDTDTERSSEEMTRGILDAMHWLGLTWDEGPHMQSAGFDRHRAAVQKLLASGHAYHCFCPPELLEQKRKEAAARKTDFKYDRTCLKLSTAEVQQRLDAGERAAIRFRVPDGAVSFDDAVVGEVTISSDMIEDFVLLRSNGQPTYHVSVVVDDIDMRITHVIRGGDHISNTPKQILLYRALGAPLPVFAHIPLILGPDKTRLSKRHGATSVMSYQEQGILPEAMLNFLALLGWSPGNDQEMFDLDELARAFSLQGISKANAVFNPDKLMWFNAQYIAKLPHEKLVEYLKPEYIKAGLWRDSLEKEESDWFRRVVDLYRPRSKVLHDFPKQSRFFFIDHVEFDPAAVEKFLKDDQVRGYLRMLGDRIEAAADFTHDGLEVVVRRLAEELGVKAAVIMNPARVALTGQAVAPGLFDVMLLLGREKTARRLRLSEKSV